MSPEITFAQEVFEMVTFILLWVLTGLVGLLVLSIRRRRRWARINRELLESMDRAAEQLKEMMVIGTIESLSYGFAGIRRPVVRQICRNNIGWDRIQHNVQDLRQKGVLQ